MPERLLDGTSYETPEGDILPLADIEEPAALAETEREPDIDDIVETERSETYWHVRELLDASIEKSRNFSHYKVEYNGAWVPLGTFLATALFKLGLTDKERDDIIARYVPLNEAHEAARSAARTFTSPEDETYAEYEKIYDEMDKKHASPDGARAATYEAAKRRGVPIPPELQR